MDAVRFVRLSCDLVDVVADRAHGVDKRCDLGQIHLHDLSIQYHPADVFTCCHAQRPCFTLDSRPFVQFKNDLLALDLFGLSQWHCSFLRCCLCHDFFGDVVSAA